MTTLRPLRAGDEPALRGLLEATGVFTPEEVAVATELIEGGGTDGYRFVVAEDEGAPIGYACFGRAWFTDGTWDLYWIAVDPVRQQTGVGGELLGAAEAGALGEGGRTMLVETASKASYEPTRRFYERQGYAEIARIPDFYAAGDDKIVYAKRLDGSTLPAPAPAMRVADSPGRGRGVFALRRFKAGETIERCPVVASPSDEWEEHVVNTELTDYCFRWGEDDEDGAIPLGYGSVYNHSFTPNARYVPRLRDRQMEFIAIRDIDPGEEITTNYRDPESLEPI